MLYFEARGEEIAMMRNTFVVLRETFAAWNDHDAPRWGAALAFYTLLSLAPLVILAFEIVSLVFSRHPVWGPLRTGVQNVIGITATQDLSGIIHHAARPTRGFPAVAGIVTLLYGASGVFTELRAALNRMWDTSPNTEAGVWETIRGFIASVGMIIGIGCALSIFLVLSIAVAALDKFVGGILPEITAALSAFNFLVSLTLTTLLFLLIFRYVPDLRPEARMGWRDLWIGAAVTAFLFTTGKHAIALYLARAAIGSAYGAAGSFVAIVVWVYYSAMIFLLGAEFTHVLSQKNHRS